VRQFLQIKEEETGKVGSKRIIVRTPNFINSEIERLRQQLNMNDSMSQDEFKELQKQVHDLQERRERSEDDLRIVEKFYELKREWEIRKIRSGTFDGNEFSITEKIEKTTEPSKNGSIPLTNDSQTSGRLVNNDELLLQSTRRSLFDQEAILSDLAENLSKQKLLSKEICSEIVEQNRLLGRAGEKQEIVAEEFKGSNDRVRKLLDK